MIFYGIMPQNLSKRYRNHVNGREIAVLTISEIKLKLSLSQNNIFLPMICKTIRSMKIVCGIVSLNIID